ncbi:hypothetical protein FOA52_014325 [Chlamydomonas sp. UWO 241]|nr:hypothetical protein FOA52_014325 [Chlamydomonas sp. UWO 241]
MSVARSLHRASQPRASARCLAQGTSSGVVLLHEAPHPKLHPDGWRRFVNVDGVPSEIIGIDAVTSDPELQLLLVPGNPGNAKYYETHLRGLHTALGGRASVMAVSHAGHEPELTQRESGRLYSIQDQVAHKTALMRSLCLAPGSPPLVVLGHSIGAYVALNAVHALEQEGSRDGLHPGACSSATPAATPAATTATPAATPAKTTATAATASSSTQGEPAQRGGRAGGSGAPRVAKVR